MSYVLRDPMSGSVVPLVLQGLLRMHVGAEYRDLLQLQVLSVKPDIALSVLRQSQQRAAVSADSCEAPQQALRLGGQLFAADYGYERCRPVGPMHPQALRSAYPCTPGVCPFAHSRRQ